MPESQASPPRPSRRQRQNQPAPALLDEVIVAHILTRVPAAAAARFRAVCRSWRAALTSDDALPQIVFVAQTPAPSTGSGTAFYRCELELTTAQNGSSSDAASARELVNVGNVRPADLVLSGTRPCHGLTLLLQYNKSQPSAAAHHVCNLLTGEHVSLPPCTPARSWIPHPHAPCCTRSSTGLGFDPAAGEHKVVRLFEDWEMRQRCEVYGLRSGGGWRPVAGQVPPHDARSLDAVRPPVFLHGCFYWHIDVESKVKGSFNGQGAVSVSTPEPILSLAVDTEQFGWARPPEQRTHRAFHLTELDGALCAVVDLRFTVGEYELWTRPAGSFSGAPPSWSLRCRISLASLPGPVRDDLRHGARMLPLASSFGGKILLASSCHEVHAYDPEKNRSDRAFDMCDFVKDLGGAGPQLNIALHEECVTGVWHRPAAADAGQLLEMKIGRGNMVLARREGQRQHRNDSAMITDTEVVRLLLGGKGVAYQYIGNMYYN